ncbi:MAG TPA: hypothetical protein VE173_04520, partial [Longimicrobiales bacterium]|nr:hypothetical protein [Longimicrobiales bacterium]
MNAVREGRDHGGPPVPSANDLLKERWGARIAWSIVAAVGLHAGAFVLWPGWEVQIPDRTREQARPAPLALVALPDRARDPGARGARAVLSSLVLDSLSTSADGTHDGDGQDEEPAALSDALRERLVHGGGLIPTVVEREPDPEPAPEEPLTEGGEATDLEGQASSTAELATPPDPTDLDLDRLSAVRPELALTLPSSWVLIRNPMEVEQFMRR